MGTTRRSSTRPTADDRSTTRRTTRPAETGAAAPAGRRSRATDEGAPDGRRARASSQGAARSRPAASGDGDGAGPRRAASRPSAAEDTPRRARVAKGATEQASARASGGAGKRGSARASSGAGKRGSARASSGGGAKASASPGFDLAPYTTHLGPGAGNLRPSLPVRTALLEAERLRKAAEAYAAQLKKLPGFVADHLRALPKLIELLSEAERAWGRSRFAKSQSSRGALRKEAEQLRSAIMVAGRYLLRRDEDAQAELARIDEGEGLADLVQDLDDLADFVDARATTFALDRRLPKQAARRARQLAVELRDVDLDDGGAMRARNLAAVALEFVLGEVRAAARYLFADEPRILAPFLSRYDSLRKARARARRKPKGPGGAPAFTPEEALGRASRSQRRTRRRVARRRPRGAPMAARRADCPRAARREACGTRREACGTRREACGTRREACGTRREACGTRREACGTRQRPRRTSDATLPLSRAFVRWSRRRFRVPRVTTCVPTVTSSSKTCPVSQRPRATRSRRENRSVRVMANHESGFARGDCAQEAERTEIAAHQGQLARPDEREQFGHERPLLRVAVFAGHEAQQQRALGVECDQAEARPRARGHDDGRRPFARHRHTPHGFDLVVAEGAASEPSRHVDDPPAPPYVDVSVCAAGAGASGSGNRGALRKPRGA